METGKTARYFKYAIGEIILVVIGILIALQINTWNENRKELLEERSILTNLHEEFIENKKVYEKQIKESQDAEQAGYTLMSLMGKPINELKAKRADSLLFNVLESGEFRPSENTINDLIQSGRLRLLRNGKLKTSLYNWQSELKGLDSRFKRLELKIDDELIPYLSENYAMKDIDKYGYLNWKDNTSLKIDKYKIFNDIKFENIMDDYLYRVIAAKNNLTSVGTILDAILAETKE